MKQMIKSMVYSIPWVGPAGRSAWVQMRQRTLRFEHSSSYWEGRYRRGQTSGAGSYGRLARFKADFLNKFVRTRNVAGVVELGCGDGNQLSLSDYPRYVGLDVSPTAVDVCRQKFSGDPGKSFHVIDPRSSDEASREYRADMALSLDVIYHLVESDTFEAYMGTLFQLGQRYVIIYSSDHEQPSGMKHVRHRRFSRWVETRQSDWTLSAHVPNRYPFDESNGDETSFADFFVYERKS